MTVTEASPASDARRVGETSDWYGPTTTIPQPWHALDGASLNRVKYWALFCALVELINTVTYTNASPAVFTTPAAHGLAFGDPVFFIGIGGVAPPSQNVQYYVLTVPSSTTFTLGSTRTYTPATNVLDVTSVVNAGGVQVGTAYLFRDPHGISSSTTFDLPDARNGRQAAYGTINGQSTLGLPIGEVPANASLNVAAGGDYALTEVGPLIIATKIIYTGVSA